MKYCFATIGPCSAFAERSHRQVPSPRGSLPPSTSANERSKSRSSMLVNRVASPASAPSSASQSSGTSGVISRSRNSGSLSVAVSAWIEPGSIAPSSMRKSARRKPQPHAPADTRPLVGALRSWGGAADRDPIAWPAALSIAVACCGCRLVTPSHASTACSLRRKQVATSCTSRASSRTPMDGKAASTHHVSARCAPSRGARNRRINGSSFVASNPANDRCLDSGGRGGDDGRCEH